MRSCGKIDKNYQQEQHINQSIKQSVKLLRNVQYICRISCQKQKSFSSYIAAATECFVGPQASLNLSVR